MLWPKQLVGRLFPAGKRLHPPKGRVRYKRSLLKSLVGQSSVSKHIDGKSSGKKK